MRGEAVKELDEFLPETNGGGLQKMVSMSALLNVNLNTNQDNYGGDMVDDFIGGDPFFNQDSVPMGGGGFDNDMNFEMQPELPREVSNPLQLEEDKQVEEFAGISPEMPETAQKKGVEAWIANNIDNLNKIELQDRDMIDQVDLFYHVPT